MQHRHAAYVTCVVVSIASMFAAPAMAGYSNFVFAPQADSPGNDYKRVGGLSFDECVNRCDAGTACNALTYNRLKQICFLNSAAAQWTIINLGAITGIRLSPFSVEEETKQDQSPVPNEKKELVQAQAQLATTSLPYPLSALWFDLLLFAFLVRELRRCRKNGCGHNARLPLRRIGTSGIERRRL